MVKVEVVGPVTKVAGCGDVKLTDSIIKFPPLNFATPSFSLLTVSYTGYFFPQFDIFYFTISNSSVYRTVRQFKCKSWFY